MKLKPRIKITTRHQTEQLSRLSSRTRLLRTIRVSGHDRDIYSRLSPSGSQLRRYQQLEILLDQIVRSAIRHGVTRSDLQVLSACSRACAQFVRSHR